MSKSLSTGHASWRAALSAYAREFAPAFMLLSLLLVWRQTQEPAASPHELIRAGILRDLAAELPNGRQAAVSSFAFMPLTLLASLPFLPLLPPQAYGLAHLYGLALLLALSVHPLGLALRSIGAERFRAAAVLLPAAALAGADPFRHGDLMACLSMLTLALFFERRPLPEVRALAGIFWGLTLFAHAAGLLLLSLRLLLALARRVRSAPGAEDAAVHWVQSVCAAYMILVYLFLNGIIMGTPLYPLRSLRLPALLSDIPENPARGLAEDLARHGGNAVPVVSGHWGYLVRPLLDTREGYHFFDFHPDKLPPADRRDFVLVVPGASNPLRPLADGPAALPFSPRPSSPHLLLAQTPDWAFYLIDTQRPPR